MSETTIQSTGGRLTEREDYVFHLLKSFTFLVFLFSIFGYFKFKTELQVICIEFYCFAFNFIHLYSFVLIGIKCKQILIQSCSYH